ncbi:class I SAM-dependent methyltransferase [Methylobacterium sp. P31]
MSSRADAHVHRFMNRCSSSPTLGIVEDRLDRLGRATVQNLMSTTRGSGRLAAPPRWWRSGAWRRGSSIPFNRNPVSCLMPRDGIAPESRKMDALTLIRETFVPLPGKRILDIGCGPGTLAKGLVEAGASVTGIDPGEAALARARATVPAARFEAASGEALPFPDGSFDGAVLLNALHHVPNPAAALAEAARVLAPGEPSSWWSRSRRAASSTHCGRSRTRPRFGRPRRARSRRPWTRAPSRAAAT